MTAEREDLREYIEELERTSVRLRSGEADREEAAALVERCAELATRISAALDEQARDLTAELPLDEWPEQERLL